MTGTLADIWRHPIKAIGREPLDRVVLRAGEALPGDRVWAVAHDASRARDGEWARCAGFVRAASSPALMAVEARTTPDGLHLTHPDRAPLEVDLDADPAVLLAWVEPLVAPGRARPARVLRAPAGRGMTDSGSHRITLAGTASHAAVEEAVGEPLSRHRWRANLWIDGLAPWGERDLIGRRVRLGDALLDVVQPVERCQATAANPETGVRDADLLAALGTFGHRDFSVGCVVVEGGAIAVGDTLVPA